MDWLSATIGIIAIVVLIILYYTVLSDRLLGSVLWILPHAIWIGIRRVVASGGKPHPIGMTCTYVSAPPVLPLTGTVTVALTHLLLWLVAGMI